VVGLTLNGMAGSPLASALKSSLAGGLGTAGWRRLSVACGLPAMLLDLTACFILTDRAENAHVLSDAEKRRMHEAIEADRGLRRHPPSISMAETIRSPHSGGWRSLIWRSVA